MLFIVLIFFSTNKRDASIISFIIKHIGQKEQYGEGVKNGK
nr:MAG TPA: hypothetical protein [Caudoviricetes sp.]